MFLEELLEHFDGFYQKFTGNETRDIWLDIGGKALPWGMPFYTAIDMYWNSNLQAPIPIIVHFR